MKGKIHSFTALLLSVMLIVSAFTALPATVYAAEGDVFTVNIASGAFPKNSVSFSESELAQNDNKVTVSFYTQIDDYKMLNCQWGLHYDSTVLELDKKATTKKNISPSVGNSMMVNLQAESSTPTDTVILGNVSSISDLFPMCREDGSKIGLITATFIVVNADAGETTVTFDFDECALALVNEDDEYILGSDATLASYGSLRPVNRKLTLTTAAYTGVYDPDHSAEGVDAVITYEAADEPEPIPDNDFKVTAKSNLFPESTMTFTKDELAAADDLVTVSYFVELTTAYMLNCQFELHYDSTVLELDRTKTTKTTISPAIGGNNLVINFAPSSSTPTDSVVLANATSIAEPYRLYRVDNSKIALVTATFKVVNADAGATEVMLNINEMKLCDVNEDDEYAPGSDRSLVLHSEPQQTNERYILTTSAYTGEFDPEHSSNNDAVKHHIPDDPKPPVIDPEDYKVKIIAKSNIFPDSVLTLTDEDLVESNYRVTVTYYIKDTERMVNLQMAMGYDKDVLTVDLSETTRRNISPVLDGENAIVNFHPKDSEGGLILVNGSNISELYPLCSESGEYVALAEAVFTVDPFFTGETVVNLDVQEMTVGEVDEDGYYIPESENLIISNSTPNTLGFDTKTSVAKGAVHSECGTVYKYGDADLSGKVDIDDVTFVQLYLANRETLEGKEAMLANVNGDNIISIEDVTAIQLYLAKRLKQFPAEAV